MLDIYQPYFFLFIPLVSPWHDNFQLFMRLGSLCQRNVILHAQNYSHPCTAKERYNFPQRPYENTRNGIICANFNTRNSKALFEAWSLVKYNSKARFSVPGKTVPEKILYLISFKDFFENIKRGNLWALRHLHKNAMISFAWKFFVMWWQRKSFHSKENRKRWKETSKDYRDKLKKMSIFSSCGFEMYRWKLWCKKCSLCSGHGFDISITFKYWFYWKMNEKNKKFGHKTVIILNFVNLLKSLSKTHHKQKMYSKLTSLTTSFQHQKFFLNSPQVCLKLTLSFSQTRDELFLNSPQVFIKLTIRLSWTHHEWKWFIICSISTQWRVWRMLPSIKNFHNFAWKLLKAFSI